MPKSPYRSTPIVLQDELTDYSQLEATGEAQKFPVGSDQWFDWVQTASRFAYKVWVGAPTDWFITLTFRREVKQRGGVYWVAYTKSRAGKLHKVYAGKPDMLDLERLEKVGQLMLEKLAVSYPTVQAEAVTQAPIVEKKPRKPRTKRVKQPKYPPLTRAELKPFHVFTKMLDFCSDEFEKRWGRSWRWAGGKIARNYFDKLYYVWSKDGSEHEFLADQRYFIMTRLLHWVNYGYDKGYDHKLPNF